MLHLSSPLEDCESRCSFRLRCVCIAILYSEHCRHLIYFREIYLPCSPSFSLLLFFSSSSSSSSLSLFIYHAVQTSRCLPSICLPVHKTTYSSLAMDHMYMTPSSDYCASPIAFPNVPELLSCSFDDVSTDPSPSPPMVSVATHSIH